MVTLLSFERHSKISIHISLCNNGWDIAAFFLQPTDWGVLCLSMSVCICLCLSVSVCVCMCLSVSLCVCLYPSVSVCVYMCLRLNEGEYQ